MVITYEAYDLEYSNPIKFINNNKYDLLLIKNPNFCFIDSTTI